MVQVYVSLGSNIRPEAHICSCTRYLQARFKKLLSSDVYKTPSQGFAGDCFLNSVVGFETDMSISALRSYLKYLEDLHGRIRQTDKFVARTLDLDLLLYGNMIQTPVENLPHDDILTYSFVLYPLAEIAAHQVHPTLKQEIGQIALDSPLERGLLTPVKLRMPDLPLP